VSFQLFSKLSWVCHGAQGVVEVGVVSRPAAYAER